MEETKLNIYQKLAAITDELGKVAKDLKITNYKAVSEGNILAAVKPLENKYGVYSYPYSREIVESGFVETKAGTKNYFERIKVVYRFINIDNPTEFVDVASYGDGIDSGDKSVGKAMTYADKYALMKAYKIETGDDPDAKASEEYTKTITTHVPPRPVVVKFGTAPILRKKCEELHINLQKLADYKHKEMVELTDNDLKEAIAMKEQRNGRN